MGRMVRTNIVIDEDLVQKVIARFGLQSKREAVHFALGVVLGEHDHEPITDPWKAALELEGMWADMTDEEAEEIWGDEVPDTDEAAR
jgi:Arc/MetJ family transcription regulator